MFPVINTFKAVELLHTTQWIEGGCTLFTKQIFVPLISSLDYCLLYILTWKHGKKLGYFEPLSKEIAQHTYIDRPFFYLPKSEVHTTLLIQHFGFFLGMAAYCLI